MRQKRVWLSKMSLTANEHLTTRFPKIHFHLSFSPFEKFTLIEGGLNAARDGKTLHGNLEEELASFQADLKLDGIQFVYIYGIGLGYYYSLFQSWLAEKEKRALIFLEDDLGAIDAFLQMPHAAEILSHPQVHLLLIDNDEHLIAECISLFPSNRIEFRALKHYDQEKKKRFEALRLLFFRRMAKAHALFSEALFSDLLFENVASNFLELPHSFSALNLKGEFSGIPAIICGAGPSLAQSVDELHSAQDRALIFAGGSSIAALNHYGIEPHFALAFDPNPEEYERMKLSSSLMTPFFFGSRLFADVFSLLSGPPVYMKSETGGMFEAWLEHQLGIEGEAIGKELSSEALSVTTMAIALAQLMGCNPIILCGVDLAYTDQRCYADGILENNAIDLSQEAACSDRYLVRKDRKGKLIYTAVRWVMESDAISDFALKFPKTEFINATEGGIGFHSIAYESLSSVLIRCDHMHDHRGIIHSALQRKSEQKIEREKILALYQTMLKSLERCLELCQQMLMVLEEDPLLEERNGALIFLQMELEEEIAYPILLMKTIKAMEKITLRNMPFQTFVEKEKCLWLKCQCTIQSQIAVLQQLC
jgi:hypothetical protein